MIQVKPFSIILEDAYMISPKVKHFKFRSHLNPAFSYSPGQFITIHFEYQQQAFKRSYSIANAPQEDNTIEFAAGFVEKGPGTELLFNLKPGDSIQITGPYGRLILKDELPKRYILVATSTGVTPYRSMLPQLKQRLAEHPTLEVVILQGVQKREEVLYHTEFLALAKDFSRCRFQAHLSRELSEELAAHERTGYVQTAFSELQLSPENDMIYLCGNPAMIDESFTLLKELGFTPQQVIREKYISNNR